MKLREFLKDDLSVRPGSVKIPIKPLIDQYRERYEALVKEKPFQYDIYKTTPGNRTFIHVKVPSETLTKFYYDVLIEVESSQGALHLADCDIAIFSNCPSFVYRYAYVFYHMDTGTKVEQLGSKNARKRATGMLIDMFTSKIPRDRLLIKGVEDKLGDEVLENEPVERNSLGLPLFDKSIYYAIFYLDDNVKFDQIKNTRRYRTENQVFAAVESFDQLMLKRKKQELKEREEKKQQHKKRVSATKQVELKVRSANRVVKPKAPVSAVKPHSVHKAANSTAVKRVGNK